MAGDQAQEPDGSSIDLGVLPDLIGYALRRAQIAVFQDFGTAFAELDLTPAAFSALLVIQRNPGRRQRQVGDALGIQAPNFAALLDRLVARGLAERRRSDADRRAVALHLTLAGGALLDQASALLAAHERRWSERLGEARRRELLGILHDLM